MKKKELYENIMKNVSKIIKKRLNESNDYDDIDDDIYDDSIEDEPFLSDEEEILYHFGEQAAIDAGYGPYEDDEDAVSYFEIMDELESMGYNEGDTIPADDLYKAVHKVHFPWSRIDDEDEFCNEFDVTIDWSDDEDSLTESVDDIYDDNDTFMFDDDKEDNIEFEEENEFYDNQGNWDPIDNPDETDREKTINNILNLMSQYDSEIIDFVELDGEPVVLDSEDPNTGDNISIDFIEYAIDDVIIHTTDNTTLYLKEDITDIDDLYTLEDLIKDLI